MTEEERPVILLVDDQEAKLISYEIILQPLGYRLIRARGANEALSALLRADVAVVLLDVAMPDMDGFELAAMIRKHPRFSRTAIIFVSAIHLSPEDAVKGYALGAVDYVPVPVMAEVLKSKVKVFADLHSKGRALERLNAELESRVAQRTEDLETAIARQTMLAREVDHRSRNTMAIVRSIIRLTRAPSKADYVRTLEGRIEALARSHVLLSDSRWQGAEARRIVEEEISPYLDENRVIIAGDGGVLPPTAAQGLALSIHELATNAAKYGALSVPTGSLAIEMAERGNRLDILWSESGGPQVKPPAKSGFGSTLVTASIAQLDGEVDFRWEPGGLKCRIRLPLTRIEARKQPADLLDAGGLPAAMVVESNPAIAGVVVSVLGELGFSTRGPLSKSDSAVLLAKTADLDLAVVHDDIGEAPLRALANILGERRIPWLLIGSRGNAKPALAASASLDAPFARMQLRTALAQLAGFTAAGRTAAVPANRALR